LFISLFLLQLGMLPDAAPSYSAPLFSEDFLSDRELNRTGSRHITTKTTGGLSRKPSTGNLAKSDKSNHSQQHHPQKSELPLPVTASATDRKLELSLSAAAGAMGAPGAGSDAGSSPRKGSIKAAGGVDMPFQPLSMAFKNINYFVERPQVTD
jgi:hypothetical protein